MASFYGRILFRTSTLVPYTTYFPFLFTAVTHLILFTSLFHQPDQRMVASKPLGLEPVSVVRNKQIRSGLLTNWANLQTWIVILSYYGFQFMLKSESRLFYELLILK